jgi:hypothetical protein
VAGASTLPPDDGSPSLAGLVDQSQSILGPTGAAIGELAGLTATPLGIPTPRNATVDGFVSFEDSILDPTGTLVYVDATVDLPT